MQSCIALLTFVGIWSAEAVLEFDVILIILGLSILYTLRKNLHRTKRNLE